MKMMIKFLLFALAIILLNCCTTNKVIIYDKSVPAEQLCSLEIPYKLTVTSFNGEEVNWARGAWDKSLIIKIPAGENELTVNYLSKHEEGTRLYISSAKDIKVNYLFKPGVKHRLYQAIYKNRITVEVDEFYR
jgi:uncharacterized membrane protein